MIEVTEFPHLAVRYKLMGVPKTVINDSLLIDGAVPEQALLRKIEENFIKHMISSTPSGKS
jgi:predicted DsbA family dithiol-disulfide isomerase